MLDRIKLGFLTLCFVLLSGCWIPEKFDAKVVVNKDLSYTFTYNGVLAFAPALDAHRKGQLTAKDEAKLKEAEKELVKDPNFKRATHLGKGRYRVQVEKKGTPGERFIFLSRENAIISLVPRRDGSLAISAFRPDQNTIKELKSLGIKIDGKLAVSVAKGLEVTQHNAQKAPRGPSGIYRWQIRTPDQNPSIIIRRAG